MLKVVFLLRFADAALKSSDPVRRWYESHRPIYGLPCFEGYVQNAVRNAPASARGAYAFDGYSSCVFKDQDGYEAFGRAPEAALVARESQELLDIGFLAHASAIIEEHVILNGRATAWKASLLVTTDDRATQDDVAALREIVDICLTLRGIRRLISNINCKDQPLYESPPEWLALIELWFDDEQTLQELMSQCSSDASPFATALGSDVRPVELEERIIVSRATCANPAEVIR